MASTLVLDQSHVPSSILESILLELVGGDVHNMLFTNVESYTAGVFASHNYPCSTGVILPGKVEKWRAGCLAICLHAHDMHIPAACTCSPGHWYTYVPVITDCWILYCAACTLAALSVFGNKDTSVLAIYYVVDAFTGMKYSRKQKQQSSWKVVQLYNCKQLL